RILFVVEGLQTGLSTVNHVVGIGIPDRQVTQRSEHGSGGFGTLEVDRHVGATDPCGRGIDQQVRLQREVKGRADGLARALAALAGVGRRSHGVAVETAHLPGLVRVEADALVIFLQPAGYRTGNAAVRIDLFNYESLTGAD